MAAAVADYRPSEPIEGKRAKSEAAWEIELEPTVDVLAALGEQERNGQVLVGFGAEAGEAGLDRKRRMLTDKNLDLVVYNDVSVPGIGFDAAENAVTLLTQAGRAGASARAPKDRSLPGSSTKSSACSRSAVEARRDPAAVASSAETLERLAANLARVVHAPADTLRLCILGLIAEGHVIIEDFPGVGKTMLAKSLARSLDVPFSRIQFTPDLLPSDVTGVNVFNQRANEFEFRPGPVFANVLLVDEINRASPKTQAALLEAMQENQVTIDGESYPLHRPFIVLATQNPIEYEGTYPLPEAQLDRFSMRLSLGYPPLADEARMLNEQTTEPPLDSLAPGREPRGDPCRDRRGALPLRRGEPQPLRGGVAPPHALELAARAGGEPALPGSRCFASRRRGRSRRAGTSSCRTTSRRSPARALAQADPRARGALRGPDRRGDHRRGRGADARPGLMTTEGAC